MRVALRAAAQLSDIKMKDAAKTVRHNPILDEEIHIEEELINLEEALASTKVADESLKAYPKVRRHVLGEQREVMAHCVNLISRMLQGRRLPRKYSQQDIEYALAKLVRLSVDEAIRIGKEIDADIMEVLRPFLTLKQRVELREWSMPNIRLYMHLLRRKLTPRWLTN